MEIIDKKSKVNISKIHKLLTIYRLIDNQQKVLSKN